MSRGLGKTQRRILDYLNDDGGWVSLRQLVTLDPDTETMPDRHFMMTYRTDYDSVRHAIVKLERAGMVEAEYRNTPTAGYSLTTKKFVRILSYGGGVRRGFLTALNGEF